jgi:hypothetical protein
MSYEFDVNIFGCKLFGSYSRRTVAAETFKLVIMSADESAAQLKSFLSQEINTLKRELRADQEEIML